MKKQATVETDGRRQTSDAPLDLSTIFTLKQISFRIIGQEPGLMQHSTRSAQIAEEEREREEKGLQQKKKAKLLSLEEEAALAAYPVGDGTYYHPAQGFYDAMLQAAEEVSIMGPSKRQRRASVDLQLHAKMITERAILRDPVTWEPLAQEHYVIDQRPARNPNTGGLIFPVRVIWPRWAVEITLRYNQTKLAPRMIMEGMVLGGCTIGVGAYRLTPAKKNKQKGQGGPYGGFIVEVIDG
jgi:hypothetical protein